MPTAAQLAADEAIVFTDFPTETLTIASTDYQVLVLSFSRSNLPDIGGFIDMPDALVAGKRADFPTLPDQGTQATFRGETYTIGAIDSRDLQASVLMPLKLTN